MWEGLLRRLDEEEELKRSAWVDRGAVRRDCAGISIVLKREWMFLSKDTSNTKHGAGADPQVLASSSSYAGLVGVGS